MKLTIASFTLLFSGAIAFAPSTPSFSGRCIASSAAALSAGPEDEEGGGLDLDLEEMFDMYVLNRITVEFLTLLSHYTLLFHIARFDAADKGKDFDKVIKEVKKDK